MVSIFYTTIDNLLGKYTEHISKCPNCSEKIGNILDTGEVIRRLNELYKYLPYDFSGINYRGYNRQRFHPCLLKKDDDGAWCKVGYYRHSFR